MVVYNLTIKHFLFPQLLVFFYIFTITTFFSLLTPCTSAISFNFSNFSSCFNSGIKCERSAAVENHAIQLTGAKYTGKSKGRVTYYKPMHLWDKASNNHCSVPVDLSKELPKRVIFGFSAGTEFESTIHTIYSWDLSSIFEIENSTTNHKKSNTLVWLVVGFSVGGFALVVVGLFLFVLWKRNRRDKEDDHALDEEFKREIGPTRFSYDELACATNNFNNKKKKVRPGWIW
ncbi:l-type lectin-domain containing receptor kinase ix.1 [Quercus suber]|uniref:L-type lectin-domain containing receptor kinase ix.1 n=1 Tax=Quercus suber TaxID=58331 RepID=A0AAW0MBK6_QUESU